MIAALDSRNRKASLTRPPREPLQRMSLNSQTLRSDDVTAAAPQEDVDGSGFEFH